MERLNLDIKLFSEYIINFINNINSFNTTTNVKKEILPLKLQKLLFFVYSYALKNWNKKLWDDSFEKWEFGPVVPKIYEEYSKYGASSIKHQKKFIDIEKLTNIEKLELQAFILELNEKFDAYELFALSHDLPWKKAKKKFAIKDEDIIDYYSKNDTFINKLLYKPLLESNYKFLS